MITGHGVDLIEIARIKRAISRWGEHFLQHVFTNDEITYATRHGNPYPHFAGRFAAKEAIYKALGDSSIGWKDIAIINAPSGQPQCYLRGNYHASIIITISHSKEYAVASCIISA